MTTEPDLDAIERDIGHVFRDRALLLAALTHTSFCNENHDCAEDNERLEFLGDSVVAAAVAQALYVLYPEATEGDLTRMKAALVNEAALARQARALGLGGRLRLGRGASTEDHVADAPSVLCGAFEAIVGAICLDAGFEVAREFVLSRMSADIARVAQDVPAGDAKSVLQVACLKRAHAVPRYDVLDRRGPPHDPRFTVRVTLPDGSACTGTGRSKKEAEQAAAAEAVKELGL